MSAVSSTVEVRILRFGRLATLVKLARLCAPICSSSTQRNHEQGSSLNPSVAVGVGNPKDYKTTNDFVSRHEGESKTRGMNRKSRGNGGEARV
ncbi:hypothetical protein Bca4012_005019 [Brassica carinata]